jgi:membrane protein implicated in regulation of membrane protease activity
VIDEIRWKFVASVAIIAMAVSMISGGLSGIAFGVLMFRALVGGIAFTVLAVGVNLLIVRFFPEILESGEFDGSENLTDSNEVGGRVNIVMPADDAPGPVEDEVDMNDSPAAEEAIAGTVIDRSEVDVPEELPSASDTDNLEDLDRFSGAFNEVDAAEGSGSSAKTYDGPGADNDPQEIAQAIQTVMKRDEKG